MVGEPGVNGKGMPAPVRDADGRSGTTAALTPRASALPPALKPFAGHLPAATLIAAARRARQIGVAPDAVLVAEGELSPAAATALFARHLRLPLAGPGSAPIDDAGTAVAILATGIRTEASDAGPPRYIVAAEGRTLRRLARALRADPALRLRTSLTSPASLRRQVLADAGPALADAAAFDLMRRTPERSAATLRPGRLLIILAALLGLPLAGALVLAPAATALLVQAALSVVFLSWIALRLAGCFYAPSEAPAPPLAERDLPPYSILVPLYREAASLPGLVAALGALDYPPEKLDIKLVVEADDALTRDALAALSLPAHMEEVAVPHVGPRTKPKALNTALPFARGRFVAIFDAEDLPQPDQLRRAIATFRTGGAKLACVQARLAIDNGGESWISGHFAAEYAGQFDVLLPVLEALGLPILLGGTSNHFRRDVLEEVGGWDAFNVTEDADLGVRLARAGYETAIIAATTFEEAPVTIRAWIGQRTRWLKGWAQTLLVHTRHPRALVADLGLPATLGLLLLTAGPFAAALVHPVCVGLLIHDGVRGLLGMPRETVAEVLASALATTTLIAGYAGTAFTSWVGMRRRALPLRWSLIASIPAYWLLLSWAAWRALGELIRRPHHWQKTEHGLSRRQGGQK